MDIILYFLLLLSVHSDAVRFYKPIVHATQAACEYKKAEILNLSMPDSVIGFTAICVEVVVFVKEEQAI